MANSRGSAKEKNGEKHCAVDNRGGRRRGGMDVGKAKGESMLKPHQLWTTNMGIAVVRRRKGGGGGRNG